MTFTAHAAPLSTKTALRAALYVRGRDPEQGGAKNKSDKANRSEKLNSSFFLISRRGDSGGVALVPTEPAPEYFHFRQADCGRIPEFDIR
jgi:hypothetical protein